MLSHFSHVRVCVTLGTVALQAPLSVGFSRQEPWSGLPCPPPGGLPDPGSELASLTSPALAAEFFTTKATWEAQPAYGFIFFTPFHEKKSKKDIAAHGVAQSWT